MWVTSSKGNRSSDTEVRITRSKLTQERRVTQRNKEVIQGDEKNCKGRKIMHVHLFEISLIT